MLVGHVHTHETRTRAQLLRPVCLFATPWTVAHQAPLTMGSSGPEACVHRSTDS